MTRRTRVTSDGLILAVEKDTYSTPIEHVIGWKCLHCSTAHVAPDDWGANMLADAVLNWRAVHSDCGQFAEAVDNLTDQELATIKKSVDQ